jgi:hypothetical protein
VYDGWPELFSQNAPRIGRVARVHRGYAALCSAVFLQAFHTKSHGMVQIASSNLRFKFAPTTVVAASIECASVATTTTAVIAASVAAAPTTAPAAATAAAAAIPFMLEATRGTSGASPRAEVAARLLAESSLLLSD